MSSAARLTGVTDDQLDALGRSSLHYAAAKNDVDAVRAALAAGSDIELPEKRSGYTPLHLAVQDGAVQAAELLLDAGADVEAETGSRLQRPLHLAVTRWRLSPDGAMIRLLLKHGARRDALNDRGATAEQISKGLYEFPDELRLLIST